MSLFPYEQVEAYFRDTFEGVTEVSDKKLSWPAYGGTTFFSLSEINHQTDDVRVVSEEAFLE